MTQTQERDLTGLLVRPPRQIAPASEDALRVGAATLRCAPAQLITSTTIVVDIGPDDIPALCDVADEIAAAEGLDVTVRPQIGWCAVRFARRFS
ncbi:MAG: hypothetical protein JO057_18950 [Chloroflexi bacterium]|nr:hypothetical protein [Chloroflexota bacterium]